MRVTRQLRQVASFGVSVAAALMVSSCGGGGTPTSTTTVPPSPTSSAMLTAAGAVNGQLITAGINCTAGGKTPEILVSAKQGSASYTITITNTGVTMAPLTGPESWSTPGGTTGWTPLASGQTSLAAGVNLDATLQQLVGGTTPIHLTGPIACVTRA